MFSAIMEIFALIAHLLSTSVRVAGPGGVRAVIAESLLLKHQLILLNRARKRAPRLTRWDRLLFGIGAFWVAPNRLPKIAIGIRPSTLLRFHRALIQRKYRLLFTSRARQRPGPKGPSGPAPAPSSGHRTAEAIERTSDRRLGVAYGSRIWSGFSIVFFGSS